MRTSVCRSHLQVEGVRLAQQLSDGDLVEPRAGAQEAADGGGQLTIGGVGLRILRPLVLLRQQARGLQELEPLLVVLVEVLSGGADAQLEVLFKGDGLSGRTNLTSKTLFTTAGVLW